MLYLDKVLDLAKMYGQFSFPIRAGHGQVQSSRGF